MAFAQVGALVGEHGDDLGRIERQQRAHREHQTGAPARQAVGDGRGVVEHAGAGHRGPGHGEHVEQVAVASPRAQGAHRRRRHDTEQPADQTYPKGEPEQVAGADGEHRTRVGPDHGERAAQVRAQRGDAVHGASADQREPADQPDRLPHEQRPDGVAGRPARVGEGTAHRFGERHPEHQQPQRRDLHVPDRASSASAQQVA